jgi:hypothetical protein
MWQERQAASNCLTLFGIVTATLRPKPTRSDIAFKSRRKSPINPKRQLSPGGMEIEDRDEQPSNAQPSMDESLEPDSNVIDAREVHLSKQCRPILSTVKGIQIDDSNEQVENV